MSLTTTRLGANARGLPGPAVLPPISAALSRRAALFGAVTVAGASVASTAPAISIANGLASPAMAQSTTLSANDARLIAIAAEILDVDTRASTLDVDTPDYDALIDRYTLLEVEMAQLPADTLMGVLAKARTSRIPAVAGCVNGIGDSIADDLWRLFGAGVSA